MDEPVSVDKVIGFVLWGNCWISLRWRSWTSLLSYGSMNLHQTIAADLRGCWRYLTWTRMHERTFCSSPLFSFSHLCTRDSRTIRWLLSESRKWQAFSLLFSHVSVSHLENEPQEVRYGRHLKIWANSDVIT